MKIIGITGGIGGGKSSILNFISSHYISFMTGLFPYSVRIYLRMTRTARSTRRNSHRFFIPIRQTLTGPI